MISKIFDILALGFDKIPVISKFKGARTILGLIGLVIVSVLQSYGVGGASILSEVRIGLLAFIGLALNAKGRVTE